MHVVIAGAGKVGYFLAKELMEDNEVTLIDSNEEAIQNSENMLDVLNIFGDVKNPQTYKNIQKDIDLFIAVTDSDEVNLLSCLIIDNIVNVKEKIVRLKNDFFISDNIKNRLNISKMITPASNVAEMFNYLIDFPHANNMKRFEYTKALLLSVRVYKDFEALTVLSYAQKIEHHAIVAGIERGDKFFIPASYDMIMPNDLIYFFTFPGYMDTIREQICMQESKQAVKNCILYGANQLGIEIAKTLIKKNITVKMTDNSFEKCKKANAILKNKVEVLANNYNQDSMLEAYGANTNIFIAATENDEFNITKCIEAKQKGIEKVVGIHNNKQYASIMRKLGIEVVRGEKMNAYYSILETITDAKVISQRAFCGGEGTVFLRKIFAQSPLIDTKIPLSEKILTMGNFHILREKIFHPYKNIETFEENDIIIVFAAEAYTKQIINWIKQ